MEANTPLIEARALKKYFKLGKDRFLHAVDNIDLQIYKGTTVGIVGESGCGKSTLGRTLLRLIEPTSGEILYCGENIRTFGRRKMKQMRKNMQIIFNRAAQLMDIVGLARRTANSYPHELDGGRRQRIGIARALSLNPQFIVCDEPVSALDVSIQAQILNLLMDFQNEMDLTYMFVTHDLSVVRHISDHIMVMYLGESLEYAQADELFNHPLHPYTCALLSSIPEPDISMRNKKISVIKGEVVSPIDPKPGCRFAPRCEKCMEICTQCSPELKEVAPGHFVACHKYDQDHI